MFHSSFYCHVQNFKVIKSLLLSAIVSYAESTTVGLKWPRNMTFYCTLFVVKPLRSAKGQEILDWTELAIHNSQRFAGPSYHKRCWKRGCTYFVILINMRGGQLCIHGCYCIFPSKLISCPTRSIGTRCSSRSTIYSRRFVTKVIRRQL